MPVSRGPIYCNDLIEPCHGDDDIYGKQLRVQHHAHKSAFNILLIITENTHGAGERTRRIERNALQARGRLPPEQQVRQRPSHHAIRKQTQAGNHKLMEIHT